MKSNPRTAPRPNEETLAPKITFRIKRLLTPFRNLGYLAKKGSSTPHKYPSIAVNVMVVVAA